MTLICFGVSHQTAPLSLLEKLSLAPRQAEALLHELMEDEAVREAVVLSTCNRTEIYARTSHPEATHVGLAARFGARLEGERAALSLGEVSYYHTGAAAVEHLLRVAAGADSLIVGEAEILGQLRRATELAQQCGTAGQHLSALLQRAITFGRRVRVETQIGRGNLSVASVGCRLAMDRLGDLRRKTVLILGAGETAQLAGRQFVREGVGQLLVLNRTADTARAMAGELGGEAVPIDHLQSAIERSDVVVCAVGAPHYIMTRAGLAETMAARPERPLLLLDLSMPRNIDPAAGTLPGISLFAIENLEEIARENRALREAEIHRVEHLIAEEVRAYLTWAGSGRQTQSVVELRRQIADIQQRCFERFARQMNESEQQQALRFSNSVLRATFHDVTTYLRSLDLSTEAGQLELAVIRRMFNLDALSPDGSDPRPVASSDDSDQRASSLESSS